MMAETNSEVPLDTGGTARRERLAWLSAYAVVTILSFPHPLDSAGAEVLDLGRWLCWLSPALLVLGIRGLAPRRAFRWAFFAAWAAHVVILHWLWVVVVVYGHAHPLVGVLGPLGNGGWTALFTAAFAAIWVRLERSGRASPWAAAAVWVALDHLRSWLFSGWTWATLGYAQHENALLMPLVAWTGVYGLSFITVLGGVALAKLVPLRRSTTVCHRTAVCRSGKLQATPWVALALAHLVGFGIVVGQADDEEGIETVRVAVIQGNIEQGVKWSPDWYERTLGHYEDLSRKAAALGARVIVWPETAVPGSLGIDPRRTERLSDLARETGAQLVIGAVGIEEGGHNQGLRYFDSAFLFRPDGEMTDRYDKTHLVPFGEYVPVVRLLGSLLGASAPGIAEEGLTAGEAPRVVVLAPLDTAPLPVGVPICYELLFPDLVRRFARDGSEMFFAITNDAWYGRTGAPFQFLAMTAMRSAENRLWTVRAANTGVSAIIDARGRVRERTRIFERDLLVADIPRRPAPLGGSFYARYGDVFAAVCGLATVGLWLATRERKNQKTGRRPEVT